MKARQKLSRLGWQNVVWLQNWVVNIITLLCKLAQPYFYAMKRVGQHLLFWVIFWLWSSSIVDWHNIVTNCDKSFASNLRYMAGRLPLIMLSTYILIHYLLPRFLFGKKAPYLFAFLFAIHFLITNLIDRLYVAFTATYYQWCSTTFWNSFFHYEAIFRNGLILIAVLGLATMIKFFKLFLEKEKRNNQLVLENLETKHAFLKAQVNPHFLFNALNNIYSMSIKSQQDNIAAQISNLSGIMKYLTYESNEEFVALEKEIQLIKDYIHIQQLRIDETDDVTIAFNMEGNVHKKYIAPVILLPLVENCFKHGIKLGEKSIISIHLKVISNLLCFQTKNYCFPMDKSRKNGAQGVGLINVAKRLEIAYPQQDYTFKNKTKEHTYSMKLELELNKSNDKINNR